MNKKILGIGAIVLGTGMLLGTASSAFAYRGDPSVQGPNYTPERHEAMTKAFEDNNYNAWKAQMQGKGRVTQVVNEGNFARFAEMHRLNLAGDTEGAAKIRAELGLGLRNGSGYGQGSGYGKNANR